MPEPTSTATATIAASAVAVPALTMLGMPLGLRADVLVAGFSGALAAIALLNSVPAAGDSWQAMTRTAIRRMSVALTSSLTAGYITPWALTLAAMPHELLLGGFGFVAGSHAHAAGQGDNSQDHKFFHDGVIFEKTPTTGAQLLQHRRVTLPITTSHVL